MDDLDWLSDDCGDDCDNDESAAQALAGLEARTTALFRGLGRRIRTGRLDEHDREHWIA